MTCQFTDIDVEEMEKDVQVLFKEAYSMHKKIDTPASEMLKDSVAELKSMMTTILDLGNPNLRDRHWEKIFTLVKLQYVPEMEFDLKTLIKAGIMDHKDAIGDISGVSSGEAQLEASLNKVTSVGDLELYSAQPS